MNFATPLALWMFALSGAVVALYILKVKRRPVVVPYLPLWQAVAGETRTRSLFKRLRRLFSLLLQLLILAACVLALGEPTAKLANLRKEHLVVVLDCSGSMDAVEEDGRTRFEWMLERAHEIVENRSNEDPMMILAAARGVDVLCPFSRNTLRLRDAVDAAKPTKQALDVKGALAFVEQLIRDKENPAVIFASDGAAGALADALAGTDYVLDTIGTPRDNVGIVKFATRKNDASGTDHGIFAVENFGQKAQSFEAEIRYNGVVKHVVPIELAPGQRREFAIPDKAYRGGGTLHLRLDIDDALALDNEAYAIVQPHYARRILLVAETEEQKTHFSIAFASMREIVDEETSSALTIEDYEALSPAERVADVTICLNAIPEGLTTRSNLILINTPIPEFLPAHEVGVIESPEVWDWDREHPLNRFMNYREMRFPKARKVVADHSSSGVEFVPVVKGYDGPLVAATRLGARKVVYLSFDMTAQLFPFRLAFPMMLRNAIAWFEAEEDQLFEPGYAVGAVVSPLHRVGGGVAKASYFAGGEQVEKQLDIHDGAFHFTDSDEPGPLTFDIGGRVYATCLNVPGGLESNLHVDEAHGDLDTDRSFAFLNREMWTYLALAALCLWLAEWGLYHRRITE